MKQLFLLFAFSSLLVSSLFAQRVVRNLCDRGTSISLFLFDSTTDFTVAPADGDGSEFGGGSFNGSTTPNTSIYDMDNLNLVSRPLTSKFYFDEQNAPFEVNISTPYQVSGLPNVPVATSNGTTEIYIDFGDGNGSQHLDYSTTYTPSYSTLGIKTITIEAYFVTNSNPSNYEEVFMTETFEIELKPVKSPDMIFRVLPSQFLPGELYQSTCNGFGSDNLVVPEIIGTVRLANPSLGIRKPIFFVEGSEFGQDVIYHEVNGNCEKIQHGEYGWNTINYGKFAPIMNSLVNEGYDIVMVDLVRNSTYIQNNAKALEKLIMQVNAAKYSNFSVAKNVVMGASMGGQVARVTLKEMEDNNINHDTRLYVSLDSPHQGVNLPLGLQSTTVFAHAFRDELEEAFGEGLPESVWNGWNGLMEPSTVQMVKDHLGTHYQNGNVDYSLGINSWIEALDYNNRITTALTAKDFDCERTNYTNYLSNLGYPVQTVNVAIANGSADAQGLGYALSAPLFKMKITATGNFAGWVNKELDFLIKPITGANNQIFFRVSNSLLRKLIPKLYNIKFETKISGINALDDVPGGTRDDMGNIVSGTSPAPLASITTNVTHNHEFTFTPNISTLDLSTSNYYADPYDTPTPFDYVAATSFCNSEHIFGLTDCLVNYIEETVATNNGLHIRCMLNNAPECNLNREGIVSEEETIDLLDESVKVYPNPTYASLNIELSVLGNYSISVFDMTGKQIAAKEINNNNLCTLDVSQFPQGTYNVRVLNIDTHKLTIQKVIVQR